MYTRNLFMLVLVLLLANVQAIAQEVTLYRFQGFYTGKEYFVAKPGRYDSIPKPLTDNNILSIKVPAGLKVTLYENRNCMGDAFEFYSDQNDLRKFTINGKISSFKVEKNQRNITQQFITLDNINEAFCPSAVSRGDREFDGNGPRMKCDVTLRISPDRKAIFADITFFAQETKDNWSTTEGKWSKKVYEVFESNKTIVKIDMNERSGVEWISGSALAEAGFGATKPITSNQPFWDEMKRKFPGTNFQVYVKQVRYLHGGLAVGNYGNNTVYVLPPMQGKLVNRFYLVGDTGGPDISEDTDCRDDTRVEKIEFNKVFVQIEQK
jgi:hypothetical protein